MQSNITNLDYRSVIKVSGPDNNIFLNNILTNDVLLVKNDKVIPSALLTPNGKILFDVLLFKKNTGEEIYIECSKQQHDDLIKKLKIYSLRQNISLEKTQIRTLVINKQEKQFSELKLDTRFKTNNAYRVYLEEKEYLNLKKTSSFTNDSWYKIIKHEECIPEGELEIPSNKIFPFEIDYMYNLGINFNKGCFIGQEVVSRVKYKGKPKKKYHTFEINIKLKNIHSDLSIFCSNKLIGKVIFCEKLNDNFIGFILLNNQTLLNEELHVKFENENIPLKIKK